MFNWLNRTKPEPPAPVEPVPRWHVKNETAHYVLMELNEPIAPTQALEELREMNLRMIVCGTNPMRDYKTDFYCERHTYEA